MWPFSKKSKDLMFLVQWGGYYTALGKDGKYGVWRLLDFNKDATHYTIYGTKFDHKPSFAEAKEAKVSILHIPHATGFLLNEQDLTLLGGAELTPADLEGLKAYQTAHGMTEQQFDELQAKLITFSTEHPAFLKIAPAKNPTGAEVTQPTQREIDAAVQDWKQRAGSDWAW